MLQFKDEQLTYFKQYGPLESTSDACTLKVSTYHYLVYVYAESLNLSVCVVQVAIKPYDSSPRPSPTTPGDNRCLTASLPPTTQSDRVDHIVTASRNSHALAYHNVSFLGEEHYIVYCRFWLVSPVT
eukprot:Selendium_serpulae@DN10177_c0_g1_i1.p1